MLVILIPDRPQIHTRKCHLDYNGTALLPLTSWVRGTTILESPGELPMKVYEIDLYYNHNRACTIYRTWEDFELLRRTTTPWKTTTRIQGEDDLQGLHHYLKEAIKKRAGELSIEFFLRRRVDDCSGR